MIAKFNIKVKDHTVIKGTEAEVIESQFLPSLKKTYYTVKTSTGFVYLTTKRGLLNQYKGVILPNSAPEEQLSSQTHATKKVQPKSDTKQIQTQLF